jgi:hypothetical protein
MRRALESAKNKDRDLILGIDKERIDSCYIVQYNVIVLNLKEEIKFTRSSVWITS